jgi:hypothetical protein
MTAGGSRRFGKLGQFLTQLNTQVHRAFSRHFSLSLMAHDIGELKFTRRATEGEPCDRTYAAALCPMALSSQTVWVVGKG